MARTIKPSATGIGTNIAFSGAFNGLIFRIVDVTLDTSYPTGGYPIAVASLDGFSSIVFVIANADNGRLVEYDYINSKLKLYSAAGTELSAATNVATVTIKLFVIGTAA